MKLFITMIALLLPAAGAFAQLGGFDYVYVGNAGMNASATACEVYTTKTPHNPASFVKLGTVNGMDGVNKLNAAGLSCIDGFLYGMQFPNAPAINYSAFYRVNPITGAAVKLGELTPPLVVAPSVSFINTTAGTLDQNDNYYFTAYSYAGDLSAPPYNVNMLKVYLGKMPAVGGLPPAAPGGTFLAPQYFELEFLSDPAVTAAFQAFLDHFDYLHPFNSDGGAEDLSINPTDGLFYTYMSYPDPADPAHPLVHRPMRINLATQTIRVVGTTVNSSPNREIAGCYFDQDPATYAVHFFVLFTDGQYGTVNLSTGALNYPLSPTVFPLASGSNLRGDLATNLCVVPLPVELISFTGRILNDCNLLEWNTAKEENIAKVVLERSADAKNFRTLTEMPPKGNNSKYRYQDNYTETAFYRLRFVNLDGSIELSPTIYLKTKGNPGASNTIIYPTEVTGAGFTVSGLDQSAVITIYNIEGKLISRTATDASSLQLALDRTPGIYIVTIADQEGHIISSQRVIRK